MSFAVYVTDQALDSLPQSLSFAALEKLIELLEHKLANDPLAWSRRGDRQGPLGFGNVYYDGFVDEGLTYLFGARFVFSEDEVKLIVWRIDLTSY